MESQKMTLDGGYVTVYSPVQTSNGNLPTKTVDKFWGKIRSRGRLKLLGEKIKKQAG